MVGSYEHCNEPSCSMKDGEYLNHLSDHQILKNTAPWCYMIFVRIREIPYQHEPSNFKV
jgi:hypothetical protein